MVLACKIDKRITSEWFLYNKSNKQTIKSYINKYTVMNMYIIHPPEFLVISVDCVNQLKYVLLCNLVKQEWAT